ncbi:MAG: tRNA 4-thiouridine(8) synthase ThiI [Proteobacteria bacterium]|nr:MAG: tRNA 4-thiouridine(8) synthase ThiI [Pseudomonadota bacterium]
MRFIVKVASESFIKSRSVRAWHLNQLSKNVRQVLRAIDPKVRVRAHSNRLEIDCTAELSTSCQRRLGDVPGIHSILTVESASLPEKDAIAFLAEKVVGYYVDKISGKSFVVRCHRVGEHDFSSLDVERKLGAVLLANSQDSHVKLKQPDITVSIEILRDKVYFIRDKVLGLGGYPIGTQGSVLSLISGGFDSSVASYQMMRRGCRVNYLFFNLGGPAHSLGAQQAALYLWQKFGCSHSAYFYNVSLEHFVADLMALPNPSLNGVLLKRAMMRVADVVASKARVSTLVTGESLAQVSSQTLANLSVINEGTDHLVLRPLIAMDKTDIINIAEDIGSAIFAKNMVEYCGVISKKPTVAARFSEVKQAEEALGDSWFHAALESMHKVSMANIIQEVNEKPQVGCVAELNGQTLIDIRATESPLEMANLHIPFHQLNKRFETLDKGKEYLLYCDKGVMSQLHAAYLHELGYHNVKVYRPAE